MATLVRLPFQFIPYGESFFSSQYLGVKQEQKEEKSQVAQNIAPSKRPLITPSSGPYELLYLESLGRKASQAQIKSAYKKQAIRFHPDRFGSDAMFKKIQEAYELLSNEKRRRKFDSNDTAFDSFLEDEDWNDGQENIKTWDTFKEKFEDYFDMWSKWSETSVPELGSEDTPIDKINQYYEFYEKKFTTWRDYACFDEDDDDPLEGENYDERRWLERKNKKKHLKRKQEEMKKLRDLVKVARKLDPRIVKHKEKLLKEKEEEIQRKQKLEEEKRREKFEKEQALLREKEEEERRLREEEKRQKKEKEEYDAKLAAYAEKIRELLRPYTKVGLNSNAIRKLEKEKVLYVLGEDVEMICLRLNLEQITVVSTKLEEQKSNPEKMIKILSTVVKQYREAEAKKKEEAEKRLEEEKLNREKKVQEVAWSPEELAMLAKATKVYPSGTKNRWECLSSYIGTRNAEEVQRKVGELRKGIASTEIKQETFKSAQDKLKEANDPTQWTVAQHKQLEIGLKTHKDLKGDAKWQQISAGVDGKTPEACKLRFEYCKELALKKKAGIA